MPVKLTTTIAKISSISNCTNKELLHESNQYMKSIGTSESLKITIYFARFLGSNTDFYQIQKRQQVPAFLDTRVKDSQSDPDKEWD
jgi:integrase/recombinase XerD